MLERPMGWILGNGAAVAGLVAVTMASSSCRKPDSSAPPVSATTASPLTAQTASAAAPEPVQKLLGRWLRSDGGYMLELRRAEMSGVVDAAYFNPNPIHVSRAIWMQGAAGFQIVVELNDVGYPGATYVLSHQASSDRLIGQYNQPAMQQTFDVDFVRQPKPEGHLSAAALVSFLSHRHGHT